MLLYMLCVNIYISRLLDCKYKLYVYLSLFDDGCVVNACVLSLKMT